MNYFDFEENFRLRSVFQDAGHPAGLLVQTGNIDQFAAAMPQKSFTEMYFYLIESFQTISYKGWCRNGKTFDPVPGQCADGFLCGRCQPGIVSQTGLVADAEAFRGQSQFFGGGMSHPQTLRAVAVRQMFPSGMETAVPAAETGAAGAVGAADGGFGQTVEGKDQMICLCGQSFPDGFDPRLQIGRVVPKRLYSFDLRRMRYF